MIKRIIATILAFGTLFMLTACQSTPEEDIVAKKDVDRMIEAAETENEGSDLSITEQYDIPDHFELRNPMEVAETLNENVTLMPFAEIQSWIRQYLKNELTGFSDEKKKYHMGSDTDDYTVERVLLTSTLLLIKDTNEYMCARSGLSPIRLPTIRSSPRQGIIWL